MTLALPQDTDRQNLLAGLRHSSLVRDDSGKHRVYRDEEERISFSNFILNILHLRNRKQH